MTEPDTWIGNIQKAVADYCESGCCKTCAYMAQQQAAQQCLRCGMRVTDPEKHSGECLRGDR